MSATSRLLEGTGSGSQPSRESESPFLDLELLAEAEDETAETWASGLGGLQLESPFSSAFETGLETLLEPEVGIAEEAFYDEALDEGEWEAPPAVLELEGPFQSALLPDRSPVDSAGTEELESVDDEFYFDAETGVIDGDNRIRVKKTTGVPWRWICKVTVYDDRDRYVGGGTGLLVSDRHVLTAAHVVYREYVDPYRHSIKVTPALNVGDEPFGEHWVSAKPKIPKRYDPNAKNHTDYDYALLTLKTRVGKKSFSRLGGKVLRYWGHPSHAGRTLFARLDPKPLNAKAVYTAGYPIKRGGKQLWCAAGMLVSAYELRRRMGITADMTEGQSGSPVWVKEGGHYCLVGVAVTAGKGSNSVVRVTRELVRQVRAWIREDGDTPTMDARDGVESRCGPSQEGLLEPEVDFVEEGFYDEEFDEAEWEAPPAVLELESPFRNDLELDQASLIEPETYDQAQVEHLEGETGKGKAAARMKFEFQTTNRIWRNDGKTAELLGRKYGPNDFLVDMKGARLESETRGVLEFETEWKRRWPKHKEAIEKAVQMADDMNRAGPSRFESTRQAFPFNVDHLRTGSANEMAQGFWDKRRGMEGEKERILGANEELEVEIVNSKWLAGMQSSEGFLLEHYESFLRQHEWPYYRAGAIKHARAILDSVNTTGRPVTELAKLHSLLQIIVNYIMRGQGGKVSDDAGAFPDVQGKPAKQAFTLMCRTNFASIYGRLLTRMDKRLFQRIVKNELILTEMGLDRTSPVFIKGHGSKKHQPGPTVHEWISQIPEGMDLLSGRTGKGLSAAMGRYSVRTSMRAKDRWLVKFETRNTIMGAWREKGDWVRYATELFDRASKRERDALKLVHQQGIADENQLTDFVFHARHPELKGRRIRRGKRTLAQEWLRIRSNLVRPLLQGIQGEVEI